MYLTSSCGRKKHGFMELALASHRRCTGNSCTNSAGTSLLGSAFLAWVQQAECPCKAASLCPGHVGITGSACLSHWTE